MTKPIIFYMDNGTVIAAVNRHGKYTAKKVNTNVQPIGDEWYVGESQDYTTEEECGRISPELRDIIDIHQKAKYIANQSSQKL